MYHPFRTASSARRKTCKRALAAVLACAFTLSLAVVLGGCSAASEARSYIASHLGRDTASTTLGTDAVREPKTETTKASSVTVLVYMNGSNLESEDGMASADLAEMIAAGSSDKVNVVVETLGTSDWQSYGISSRHAQRYTVGKKGLTLVDDSLGQLDCTVSKTLSDFITWGVKNYPADRYELILWDHGGGPVYGFGYDEWQDEDEALTLDEIQTALATAGTYFDFIGFDACLMSSLEVCCALYDYCDYTILSEDFESGIGWEYTTWLKALYKNPSISTPELGKTIVDSMISANEKDQYGDESTLTVIDESMMKVLFTAWVNFAYANTDALTSANYSREVQSSSRALTRPINTSWSSYFDSFSSYGGYGGFSDWLWGDDETSVTMDDYYVTDILAVAQTINSQESKALSAALAEAIIYTKATSGDADLTGISVTLPYGDSAFYSELKTVFSNCGIDKTYIEWLGNFVSASGASSFFNFDSWDDQWSGWDDYDDDFDWNSWSFNDDYYWKDSDDMSWTELLLYLLSD